MRTRIKKEQPAKRHIQEVAAKLFAKNGYDSVSIIDICNVAKVNNAMVSYYFGGKMKLYESIVESMCKSQYAYIDKLMSVDEFKQLPLSQKLKEFKSIIWKIVDFFYKEVSIDVIMMLLRSQQYEGGDKNLRDHIPGILYIRELIANLKGQSVTSEQVAYYVMSIVSLMTSPKIYSGLFNILSGHDHIEPKDIKMIKHTLGDYIDKVINN